MNSVQSSFQNLRKYQIIINVTYKINLTVYKSRINKTQCATYIYSLIKLKRSVCKTLCIPRTVK